MSSNKDFVLYFKAMADETRLAILEMLANEELCACHILEDFDITQPTLSYHMKILVESGLVFGVRDGTWMRYSLNAELMQEISKKTKSLDISDKEVKTRCIRGD